MFICSRDNSEAQCITCVDQHVSACLCYDATVACAHTESWNSADGASCTVKRLALVCIGDRHKRIPVCLICCISSLTLRKHKRVPPRFLSLKPSSLLRCFYIHSLFSVQVFLSVFSLNHQMWCYWNKWTGFEVKNKTLFLLCICDFFSFL